MFIKWLNFAYIPIFNSIDEAKEAWANSDLSTAENYNPTNGDIEIDTNVFLENIQQHIGKQVDFTEITNAWCAILLDIPPYKLTLLRMLRIKYRTFMLSNSNAIHFE